ncbi:MAG: tetratricopeptide repeat protein [Blastocatellia bacterium]
MKKQIVSGSTTFLKSAQRRLCLAISLLMFWALADASAFAQTSATNAAQAAQDALPLEPGKPITRELAGGQSHPYRITLDAGQYLNVVVEQRGIDVVVTLFGPDDKQIAEFDAEIRRHGQEIVSQVAEAAGSYRLNVQAKQKEAPAGHYEIRVAELRAATENDRDLQEARKLIVEMIRLYRAGKYGEARPLAERALEIREKSLGPEHIEVAAALNNLAAVYSAQGDYAKAETLHQRVLTIREKALGPEHPDVARSLNNLANLNYNKGDYEKVETLYQRALAILEKVLGPEHPDVAAALNNLAILYNTQGAYTRAELLFQRALAIREKTLGPEHLDVAGSLNNLGILYQDRGDYAKAESFYQPALAIQEKSLGPNHPLVALTLNNLANLSNDKGDYAKAETLHQRALTIREKAFGPNNPLVATSLDNLALTYRANGEYAKAETLHQRALAIKEKALGPQHPEVALSLTNLATVYGTVGDYAKVAPLFQRALDIREKVLGPEHPLVALSLHNLAAIYSIEGDYARAEPLYQRALAIREKSLGQEHPFVASSLNNLAKLYAAKNEATQAIAFQSRASTVKERNLALNLATGSERQKLAYLATLSAQTDEIISLHVHAAPTNPAARDLAATIILQRKGRVLDAMTDSFTALRSRFNAQDQELLDQLQSALSQLARLVLNGPQRITPAEHQSRIKKLEEEAEKLQAEISRRSAEFRAQSQPVTLAAIQAAIPAEAALVEFFVYRPHNPKFTKPDEEFGAPRYVAYVLREQGAPQWVELGEAKTIDEAIDAWRQALRDPKRREATRLARTVDRLVMQPLRGHLGATRRVLLSPDGALNLIPFAALVDERSRFLVERYEFSYLTSGRDLLRLQVRQPGRQPALIVANPNYGETANVRQAAETSATSIAGLNFRALRGTEDEAKALKKMMPAATVLMGDQATEAAVKQARGPELLHVATHGFFLPDLAPPPANSRLRGLDGDVAPINLPAENPLLRSGLVLAGFNLHRSGDDDGVLTALEATALDLWGTKLVVLSACDTGVGEVKNGEGVYGLRRALVLAGSESQVMSLWPVSDEGTLDLMASYYRALQRGQGRSAALRQVQLRMLKSGDRRHPFYWAGFIQSGEWANLQGRR